MEDPISALVEIEVSRQEAYEQIRVHSHEAAAVIKENGQPNDLLERIKADPFFAPVKNRLNVLLDPKHFIGRSEEQVKEFEDVF